MTAASVFLVASSFLAVASFATQNAAPDAMRGPALGAVRLEGWLGWKEEKRDFPAVKNFVANCHAHGVKTLAYIQFASLYHEKFALEVPDLADWAAYDADGRHRRTVAVALWPILLMSAFRRRSLLGPCLSASLWR